ncbi:MULTISPECIES: hypothetical protein [unclassified Streptomyces]|uniref:hypothetical protein n=1 Tax=unclassified Streptomyces TaxID=2593676 RepID=UPI000F6C8515|nr:MULTISPECIES: hypothetical protein [unclassified Streptomyces]AZM60886.1 hypothetical protein DLM49_16165 [Streptomyces sp. WAC 01438]RSM94547.1 hypothetical protein DMA10_18545 [Streptomyces sp. WAC 01420]
MDAIGGARGPRRQRGPRSRRARVAATSLGLAATLALTACSGDGSDDADDAPSNSTPSATATADSGGGTGGSGTSTAPASELEGSWLTTAGGKAVALMVTGDRAGLFATGGPVCSGSTQEEAGTRSISLTCDDGSGERARGTVTSVDDTSLKITWEGSLGTETYTKAEGGKLPTGFPTAGLGT